MKNLELGGNPLTISSEKFNDLFRNLLRDMYVYQFKERKTDIKKMGSTASKVRSTLSEERTRIKEILRSHVEVRRSGKTVFFCSADSRMYPTNPFRRFYRFCCADAHMHGWYLSTLLALDWDILVRTENSENDEAAESLRLDYLSSEKDLAYSLTNRQLYRLYSGTYPNDVQQDQFDNRLNTEPLGLLQKRSRGKWALNQSSLALPHEDDDLMFRICQMLLFFAETAPLGSLGDSISRRVCGSPTVIRYKHHYFMKAMNDYNLIDLLSAMARGKWIHVLYRNATDLVPQEVLCYPLQIRESTQDGRQYVLYYHPGFRSVSALRLDFIDRIRIGSINKRNYLRQDLENAREMIRYAWGTAFLWFREGNAAQPYACFEVELRIASGEPYIKNRLLRERRHGEPPEQPEDNVLCFRAVVTSPWELIPWVRSFTARILSLRINGQECLRPHTDLGDCVRDYLNQHPGKEQLHDHYTDFSFREDPKVQALHRQLFHGYFSVPFDVVCQVYFHLMGQPSEVFSVAQIKQLLMDTWPEEYPLTDKALDELWYHIRPLLVHGQWPCARKQGCMVETVNVDGYRAKYHYPEKIYQTLYSLYDRFPLTELESIWLDHILSTPKARLFLSGSEIDRLRSGIRCPKQKSFDLSLVNCYDQYRDATQQYEEDSCRELFQKLLDAIRKKKMLRVTYRTGKGAQWEGILSPLRIEYSKRDDKFRVYCMDEQGKLSPQNLERFIHAEDTDRHFSWEGLDDAMDRWIKRNRRRLTVAFGDDRNICDRLVMEFAPQERQCVRKIDELGRAHYELTLYYDGKDSLEIAIRLLSYGSQIRLLSDTGSVADVIQARITTQKEKVTL